MKSAPKIPMLGADAGRPREKMSFTAWAPFPVRS